MEERLDSEFLEKLIIKGMLSSKKYLAIISSVFEKDYFDDTSVGNIFEFTINHFLEYKDIPQRDIIINSIENTDDTNETLSDVDLIDYDITRNYDHLLTQTNDYLKEKAIKKAIVSSVDKVDDPESRGEIQKIIEDALSKDIKVDLGLNYFGDLGKRLREIFNAVDTRIPTYFPQLDEFTNGGLIPFTLSIFAAKIHGFKSNFLANIAARQVLRGHNVALMTLEMSETAFAQRFDSIYSLLDINRMYTMTEKKRELITRLRELKTNTDRGELYIKQFPTGEASVLDFKIYLRELLMRGVKIGIIYADYINLMKTAYKVENNMYSTVKRISEELRALSFEFEVPVVSVSQLNREGSFVGFEEINFNYIAESIGLPATADLMCIMGTDEDNMVYQNELCCKIVKNRLGGRVGEMFKLYYDARNLKMYDETEMEQWIQDRSISGDEREAAQIQRRQTGRGSR